MARFISYSGSRILLVSDRQLSISEGSKSLTLDDSLSHVTDDDLISNYLVWNGKVVERNSDVSPKELRVAFISNYKSKCGISTYSEKLYAALIPYLNDYKIFAEDNGDDINSDNVTVCWKRGVETTSLVSKLHEYNPDVVLIQHEYGIWPDAKIWLSLLTQLHKYNVFVVFHSVYENHDDKTVCEMAAKNTIVHTKIAYDCLKNKNLSTNIVHIPHGCDEVSKAIKPWNMYRSEHTFAQFGFGFRYKGWETSLKVVAGLKEEFPDVFFTGVFSESPFNMDMHQAYFENLMNLVDELGIQNNVGFIRGFVDDTLLFKVLMMNKAAVFPYIDNGVHTVLGCSGAARTAMTARVPVMVSNVPLFDDLTDVCPRCSSIEEIETNLKRVWNDRDEYVKQVETQNKFLEKNSWDNIAKQYISTFSKLN